VRVDRLSIQAHVVDAAAHLLAGRAGVREAADAHHVAALLVVRIGVEQVVADVLEDRLQLVPSMVFTVTWG
jgi:hypothetical protein